MLNKEYDQLYQDGIDYNENIFNKKYCLKTKNETCRDDVYNRFETELKKLTTPQLCNSIITRIKEGKIIPAGSISFGLGNDNLKCSLSNCYFVPINYDSISGIYECRKEMANTYKSRGGAGTDLSILRYKGCPVNNSAKTSSGSVSFLPGFSNDAYIIGQNGRRAAAISILDIRHPDTIDYIWCKSKPEIVFEKDFITGQYPDISTFNISLKINDEFMNAVENDKDWTFVFPDIDFEKYNTEWDGDFDKWKEKGYPLIKHNTIPARELLMQISESAWISGDPGVLFIDTVRKWSMSSFDPKITPRGVNPCLPDWAPVLTPDGYRYFKDIKNKIIINNEIHKCTDLIKTKELDDVYEVELQSGLKLYANKDHIIQKSDNTDCKLEDLNIGDYLKVEYNNILDFHKINYKEWLEGYHSNDIIDLFKTSFSFQVGYASSYIEVPKKRETDDEKLKQQVQLILNSIGVYSKINKYNRLDIMFDDYTATHKQQIKNIRKLYNQYPVYDIQVPNKNYFVSAGVVVHNCGEQTLADYENCLLSSLALHKYVTKPFTNNAEFEIDKFLEDVKLGIHFLNIMSDINEDRHPLIQQCQKDKYGKRVGQEITGLGDMLAMLGYRYGSDNACDFLDDIFYFKSVTELETSIEIAKEKGCAKSFSTKKARNNFLQLPYIQRILKKMLKSKKTEFENNVMKYGLRNSALNTVGPTGTISIITDNCSSGIEPIYKLSYTRKSRINKDQKIFHFPLLKYVGPEILSLTDDEIKKKYNYIESFDLSYYDRIKIQAIVQKWTDASISSTINLKNDSTIEDIYNIYCEGWKSKLKGITVFRNGSKQGIFSFGEQKKKNKNQITSSLIQEYLKNEKEDLNKTQRAYRYIKYWKKVKVYITVTIDNSGKPKELFANVPHEAGFDSSGIYHPELLMEKKSYWDAICRMTSLLLRLNTPIELIIKQLEKSSPTMMELPSIIIQILRNFLNYDEEKIEKIKKEEDGGEFCTVCGKYGVIYQGGCQVCILCGDSKCG